MRFASASIGLILIPVLLSMSVAVTAGPIAGTSAPPKASEPVPLPQRPDLDALEPEVAVHIQEAQDALKLLLQRPLGSAELADAQGSIAKLYHAYELNEAAEYHYRQALSHNPTDFSWHYYLGRLYQTQGRMEEASMAYADALALEADSALVLVRRGDVFLMQGRLEDAKSNYLHAFYLHPRSNVMVERMGETALGEKRYELALQYLLPAVENQPAANRIHYFIGLAYRGLGQTEAARKHMALSGPVGVEPPDPYQDELKQMVRGERLYLLRGKLAFQAGQHQAAALAFAKAVEAAPDSARTHVNLGTALAAMQRDQEAIQEYRKALELQPGQATASYNLGMLLLKAGKPDEAISPLLDVLDTNQDDASAHEALARAYRDTAGAESALKHFRLAVIHNPLMEDAWLGGAQLLLDLSRDQKAMQVLEQAHEKLPDSGQIAFALAHLLAAIPNTQLRDGTRALELAHKVFNTRPSPRHAETLALALAESGDCAQAAALQTQLINQLSQAQPDNTALFSRLMRQLAHYQAGPECRPGVNTTEE